MLKKLLTALAALFVCAQALALPYMRVTVLNVGQGLSAVVETPDGKTLVFDCGSESAAFNRKGSNRTVGYLYSRGISRAEAVVMSHSDLDHCSGMAALLRRVKADAFYMGQGPQDPKNMKSINRALAAGKTPVRRIARGDSFALGKYVRVRVVSGGGRAGGNRGSLALQVLYGGTSFLLASDMSAAEEAEMCRIFGSGLASGVLLVPHHGSGGSASEVLLDTVRPQLAVISCGRRNKYGHPSRDTLRRLQARKILFLSTASRGDITLVSDGKRTGILEKNGRAGS
ncbi:MAG: MBL fold metallo-hydrolase [Abditibacteriota bacterium]|nr:MBL fold metallo-hydrolase [Abditibacteriota bacterium]